MNRCLRCGANVPIHHLVRINGMPISLPDLKIGFTVCSECTAKILQEWMIRKQELVELGR